jgi:hypothetical protein
MIKVIVIALVALHGLIHLFGCARASDLEDASEVNRSLLKINSYLWLFGASLFMITAVLLFTGSQWWWVSAIVAAVVSQYLLYTVWKEAKYGTIVNLTITVLAIVGIATWLFHRTYEDQVDALALKPDSAPSQLTETDISTLPAPVAKYLRYARVVGKPKVRDFEAELSGTIRAASTSPWMPFTSEQHNRVDEATRLFFMQARMKQLPVSGFHSFRNGTAYMDIRLLSLFSVGYQSGPEMGIAETVTFFNDMCVMAPATLIDKRIRWLDVFDDSVKAEFQNNSIVVTAWLYFNEEGQLINFVSDDRFATVDGEMRRFRWSTPLKEYQDFGGVRLAGYAETVYSYPDGDLTYGIFTLRSVVYNPAPDHGLVRRKAVSDGFL